MKRQLTEEHKQKISKAMMGMQNHNWVGDAISYKALHQWIRRRLPMPPVCQLCMEREPHDLANTTGNYNREFLNYAWYCRSCHMLVDHRMRNLKNQEYS